MPGIHLTPEVLEWCKTLAMRRSGSVGHADTPNSQNFITGKPPWHRHYVGAIGELTYSNFTGYKVDQATIGRGDDGADFPDGSNVKASDTPNPPNLLFPQKQWVRKVAKFYVLVWVRFDNGTAEIIGKIDRESADRVKEFKNYGHGPCWLIKRTYLNQIQKPG